MMNSAMDRWGVASSSIYNHYNNNSNGKGNASNRDDSKSNSNKENASKTSNEIDSKSNDRKPLSQKQEPNKKPSQPSEQLSKILALDSSSSMPNQEAANRSFSDGSGSGSSNGSGTKMVNALSVLNRRSASAAEVLAIDSDAGLEPPVVNPPPPIHNVIHTHHDEDDMNDVSTLAGDTIAGIEMDAELAEAVPPYHRMSFVEDAMITPTYSVLRQQKKTRRRVMVDDEQSTLPESPSKDEEDSYGGLEEVKIASPDCDKPLPKVKPKTLDSYEDDDEEDEYGFDELANDELPRYESDMKPQKKPMFPTRGRFRCMMCGGCFLAFLLLLGIAALGYTLYAIRHEDQGALSLFTKQFWINAGEKIMFWKDNTDEEVGLFDDTIGEFSGTMYPTDTASWTGTFSGTNSRTIPPSFFDTPSPRMGELRSIILAATVQRELSGINGTAMNDPAAMQYSVIEWLSWDSQLDSYSNEKIVQRYALGCFYKSFDEAENENAVRATWMTEGDECTEWDTTEKNTNKQTCNENGQIRSIHMENLGLTGTLAPELALLSESLESIYLTKNSIHGTIPTAFGQMSNLQRLQLSRNDLEGTLNGPELLEPLKKLEVIGLGGNKLNGTLPPELGSMPSMVYLNVPSNAFSGTIPSGWVIEGTLKHVSFATNQLTGTVPAGLTDMESLKNLFLFENNLGGTVGPSVCDGEATYNGMTMKIDCESVDCACCGCNGLTPSSDPPVVEEAVIGVPAANSTDSVTDVPVASDEISISQALVDIVNNTSTDPDSVIDNASTSTAAESERTDDNLSETEVEDFASIEPSITGSIVTSNESSTIPPYSFPFITDTAMGNTITTLNGDPTVLENSDDFGCQSIDVGFPCYSSGWSIDFELSNRRCGAPPTSPPVTELYDIVALFQYDDDIQTPPGANIGSTKSLSDALFWASSCGLVDCDGVVANGQIYYRNTYPQQLAPLSNPWWPVPPGTMLQMQWIRTDESGMAVVIAESRPFLVANRCR
eukprot:CAMPEP_0197174696 /NCGR_PEP_ID=MMETSP1423-20130617/1094_1 /TAXON_ID=476441 /ORGANISM="Pseudo-nitzschia heimii, Strain UNC1101" /LENGTH=999 /DNA_ID=CAMNT_0042623641 /DNA_START=85 /DNA_END=3084 /DNA_ORIENTATION=-